MTQTKLQALATFLSCEPDEIREEGVSYFFHSEEYLLLSDEEADEKSKDYIRETLWAFRPSFLIPYITNELTCEQDKALAECIGVLCEKHCEDANEIIYELIKANFERLVKDAIIADGRGNFIAQYDFEENEEGDFFIYRI